jgi:hypothetical protein
VDLVVSHLQVRVPARCPADLALLHHEHDTVANKRTAAAQASQQKNTAARHVFTERLHAGTHGNVRMCGTMHRWQLVHERSINTIFATPSLANVYLAFDAS